MLAEQATTATGGAGFGLFPLLLEVEAVEAGAEDTTEANQSVT